MASCCIGDVHLFCGSVKQLGWWKQTPQNFMGSSGYQECFFGKLTFKSLPITDLILQSAVYLSKSSKFCLEKRPERSWIWVEIWISLLKQFVYPLSPQVPSEFTCQPSLDVSNGGQGKELPIYSLTISFTNSAWSCISSKVSIHFWPTKIVVTLMRERFFFAF